MQTRADHSASTADQESRKRVTAAHARRRARVSALRDLRDASIVLLRGEVGTGKLRLARALHDQRSRGGRAFVVHRCGPADLDEAHVSGSAPKRVRFGVRQAAWRARGGTLVLVDIELLPRAEQDWLLDLLTASLAKRPRAPARVVATTRHNLEALALGGTIAPKLAEWLCARTISLPPVRERVAAIVPLARLLLRRASIRYRRPPLQLSRPTIFALAAHSWPGNLSELESAMEYAAFVAPGDLVDRDHLPESIRDPVNALRPSRRGATAAPGGSDEALGVGGFRPPHGQAGAREARQRATSMLTMAFRMMSLVSPAVGTS